MHADVKELRKIVDGVDGAFVRRFCDGEIWVGVGPAGFSCDRMEIHKRVTLGGWRVVGVGGPRSWIVEKR